MLSGSGACFREELNSASHTVASNVGKVYVTTGLRSQTNYVYIFADIQYFQRMFLPSVNARHSLSVSRDRCL